MRVWQLPDSLQESVRYHPEPEKAQEYPLETAIVHIAVLMTAAAETDVPINECALSVEPHVWRVTGLSEEALPDVKAETDQHAAETFKLMFPESRAA